MASFLDLGLIQYFSAIFPVLLVFAVVYALLQKTKAVGGTPTINALIAIVAGFLILLSEKAIAVVNFIIPWFAVVIIFFVLMILVFYTFGLKEDALAAAAKDKAVYWTILGVVILIVIAGMASVFGQEALQQSANANINASDSGDFQQNIWVILNHPKVLGMMILFAIAIFAVFLLSG